jgi:formylglycine-generating enzyme required for sulfatase activity
MSRRRDDIIQLHQMVLIPAGEFLMGSDPKKDKDAEDSEQPQHILYLPDYYLAKTPVTNAQYQAFMLATGYDPPEHWEGKSHPRGKGDHPVVRVSWHDAVAYCNWLAEVTGKPYRLPSEAEWEKGARGSDGHIWPWGDQWDAKRCNALESGKGGTTPVGAYPQGASPYGLLDMAGNVWEWTLSLHKGYPYRADDGREDLGAGDDVFRVPRGGSWGDLRHRLRSAIRDWLIPIYRSDFIGVRCAEDKVRTNE